MGSCKKKPLAERILDGDVPESTKSLISYGNQLNGIIRLYERKKLRIGELEHKKIEKAYGVITQIMASRGVELNYIPYKRQEHYIDKHRKITLVT